MLLFGVVSIVGVVGVVVVVGVVGIVGVVGVIGVVGVVSGNYAILPCADDFEKLLCHPITLERHKFWRSFHTRCIRNY